MVVNRRPQVRVVRLWWRCRLCGRRLDTFGVDHDDGLGPFGPDAVLHLDACHHDIRVDTYPEALGFFEPAGATSRVNRHHVLAERPGGRSARRARRSLQAGE